MNEAPTLEEMMEDYKRHMSWYVPTMNKLQERWNELIRSSRGSTNES